MTLTIEDIQKLPEAHFRNVLFVLCKLLDIQVDAEYMTSDGRIDLLIRTTDFIYVIECKLDSSAKVALKQIERKEYDLPWSVDNRKIILIGINFSSTTRRMTDWLVGGQNESPKVVKEGGQRGGQTTEQILGLIKKILISRVMS